MAKPILNEQFKRMQKIAGLLTENEESVTSGLKLNLTDESNWNILYGPGGRTFQVQQIRPKTDPTAPMGDSGRKNRVGLDINVSERKNQVTIAGDSGNSIAFVKIIDGMFNSGASRIKPLGNTGAMETFITLDQLDQLAPGLYERDEVTESMESTSNSFYQDMMSANPGWNREKVMDMVKNEVDPDEEFGNEEHQEYLEDSESYFDMLQASGPTVKPGDSVEVFDKMKRKFIPGKIVKATKLKGNFMYNGNVEPNNIPAWEISDADGRKVYYPQYREGEAFKKSNMTESMKPTSKTTKKRLTAQIKEMILAEMDSSEMNDGNKTPTNPGVPNDSTDMALDMIKKGIPEAKKKSKKDEEAPEEAPEEMDAEIDAEVDTEMPMDTPEPSHTDVQKELTDALEAAKASGDEKLVRQIGNALTYFTRSQVAGEEGNMGGLNESFVKKMQRTAGIIK
jgi:hypothetical protein